MKRFAQIWWPVLLLSCGPGEDGAGTEKQEFSLVGTWIIDVEGTTAEIDKWPAPEDAKKNAKEFFAGEKMAAVEFDYRKDGTTEVRNRPGTDGPVQGTWEVTSRDDDRWTVLMKEPGAPTRDPSEITWIDKNHTRVVEAGKTDAIVLKRK